MRKHLRRSISRGLFEREGRPSLSGQLTLLTLIALYQSHSAVRSVWSVRSITDMHVAPWCILILQRCEPEAKTRHTSKLITRRYNGRQRVRQSFLSVLNAKCVCGVRRSVIQALSARRNLSRQCTHYKSRVIAAYISTSFSVCGNFSLRVE